MQNAKKTPQRITGIILFLLATWILLFYPQHMGAWICFYIVAIGYIFIGW